MRFQKSLSSFESTQSTQNKIYFYQWSVAKHSINLAIDLRLFKKKDQIKLVIGFVYETDLYTDRRILITKYFFTF